MQVFGRMSVMTVAAALFAGAGLMGAAGAQDGHDHAGAQHGDAHKGHDHGGAKHGGAEAKTKRHHFEAIFSTSGMKLIAHRADHKAIDAMTLAATATFYLPSAPNKPWFRADLKPGRPSADGTAEALELAVDLSKVPASGAKVAFRVSGLPDPSEPTVEFTVPFALAKSGGLTVTKATKADQAAINQLKVCPVSHEDLGSMGGPLKVSRGGQSMFICCKGCLKQVQADPDKYLSAAGAPKAKGDHDHGAHKH